MEKAEIVERLIRNARENGATDAVVVDAPPEVLRDAGANHGDGADGRAKVDTTLVAGPVAEETDEHIALEAPSRVGAEEDFSAEVRKRLRPDGVYGFRDGNLDGERLPKDEVEVHRVQD